MKALATTRLMLTWLSMCPTNESTAIREKYLQIAYTLVVLIMNLIGFVSSLAYCLKFISIDFNGATFAFMVAIGEFGLIYFMIAAILKRQQIFTIVSGLSSIYESYENEVALKYLTQASNTSEWIWTIYFKYVTVSLGSMIGNSILSVLYCHLTEGHFNADHLYRPDRFVFPWNQNTPTGYFVETLVSILVSYSFFIVNGTPLLFFISICIHHQAMSNMFKLLIDNSEKCDAKQLCDLIRLHVLAKDWFNDSANIYNPFVLVQLICSTIMLTISVFYLDLQWQQFDFIVASVLIATSIGMSTLLFYCYFGQSTIESYEKMSDLVCDMDWLKLSNGPKKYLILMIENMQKPVYYHGFEVAKLDLQTFVKLISKVLSYYIMIKAFASK